jgi:hypothetical protein
MSKRHEAIITYWARVIQDSTDLAGKGCGILLLQLLQRHLVSLAFGLHLSNGGIHLLVDPRSALQAQRLVHLRTRPGHP